MNPLISVIVPIYTAPKEIFDRAIDSILNQTYSNLELILIDDNPLPSKTSMGPYLEEISKKDKRIRLIHNSKNLGLFLSRKAGVDAVKGEYIFFMDADDYIESDTLQFLYNLIINENVDIVFGGVIIEENNKRLEKKYIDKVYTSNEALNDFLYDKNNIKSAVWGKLYKKELFNNIAWDYPFPFFSEDYFTLTHLLLKCKKIYTSSECFYHYVMNPSSITHSKSLEKKVMMTNEGAIFIANSLGDRNKKGQKAFIALEKMHCLVALVNGNASKDVIKKFKKEYKSYIKENKILKDKGLTFNSKFILFIYMYFPKAIKVFRKVAKKILYLIKAH